VGQALLLVSLDQDATPERPPTPPCTSCSAALAEGHWWHALTFEPNGDASIGEQEILWEALWGWGADPELPGELSLRLAGRRPRPEPVELVSGEGFLATAVRAG
jgi:hypothetical protein